MNSQQNASNNGQEPGSTQALTTSPNTMRTAGNSLPHPPLPRQFGISAQQAQAWLDEYGDRLPRAQRARYQAILQQPRDAIARLAAAGGKFCRVIGKDPKIGGEGWQNRPYTEKQIRAWGGNAGLICGQHSGGLICLDVDDFGYTRFKSQFPGLANTFTIGHAGKPDRAKLFYLIDGPHPPNAKPKGLGLELFSTGLQVVIQGTHPDGHPYQIWNKAPVKKISHRQLNKLWHKATGKWLYPKARVATKARVEPTHSLSPTGLDHYANAVLKREVDAVARARVGDRNNQLYRSACSLFEFVAAGRLYTEWVEAELFNAACKCGLDQDKGGSRAIWATIGSGAKKGLANPRYAGLPQKVEEPLPDRVKACGELHPICGKGKRYLDPTNPTQLLLIPWHCGDYRNCSTCAGKVANTIRAKTRQAKTAYYTFLTEGDYRKLVRALGKKKVIRIPQPGDEVVVIHIDPDSPGQPVTEQFLTDVYSFIRAIPDGKRVSGKLGARTQARQEKEEEDTGIPMQVEWIETNTPTSELEDVIYQATWERVADQALARLAGPGSLIRIERTYKWLMAEFKADVERAGYRVTASGTMYRLCDRVKLREWVSTYVLNHSQGLLEPIRGPAGENQPQLA